MRFAALALILAAAWLGSRPMRQETGTEKTAAVSTGTDSAEQGEAAGETSIPADFVRNTVASGEAAAPDANAGQGIGSQAVGAQENAQESAAQPLPERYDLREYMELPAVPDQGSLGTCWAFASLTALTTSMPEDIRQELSADHMSLQNSYGLGQNAGGDSIVSMAYLLAWQGPVAAKEDPYGDGISPEGLSPVCHVQEIRLIGRKDYEAIKHAICRYGGVQSSLYIPAETGNNFTSFYYNGEVEPNHDVVIVGWDDSYPRENFSPMPGEDGAFLCMNSWGESFGDKGCFYVSYEDSQIGTYNVSYSGVEPTDHYDKIYQADLCGWTGQMGYGDSKAWFANVYETGEEEQIAAVGLYATAPDTSCRIFVAEVPDIQEQEKINEALSSGILVAEAQFEEAGFYTVSWQPGTTLAARTRFAVVVEIDSPGTDQPVAVEYRSGNRTANVDVSDGEGYISLDGTAWERVETRENGNICLKAYSRCP